MDDIKRTLSNITKNFTKISSDLFKSTKLSITLANEEEKLKSLYTEIGKKVHEIYMYGGSLGKFFDEKYKEIQEVEMVIHELKGQISVVSGSKPCPKCGKAVESSSEFCPKCGYQMKKDSYVSDVTQISEEPCVNSVAPVEVATTVNLEETPGAVMQAPVKNCPTCGSINEINAKFCLSCGRLI